MTLCFCFTSLSPPVFFSLVTPVWQQSLTPVLDDENSDSLRRINGMRSAEPIYGSMGHIYSPNHRVKWPRQQPPYPLSPLRTTTSLNCVCSFFSLPLVIPKNAFYTQCFRCSITSCSSWFNSAPCGASYDWGRREKHEWHIEGLHGYIKNKRILNGTIVTIINMKQDFMHMGLSCMQSAFFISRLTQKSSPCCVRQRRLIGRPYSYRILHTWKSLAALLTPHPLFLTIGLH